MGAVVEAKLSFFYFFWKGPLRPKRPVEVAELSHHRLRRHTSCWLGGFGTPGPCRDGACAGPLAAALNAVLPQASCPVVMSGLCGRLETTLRRQKKMRKWKIGILFPAGIRRPCGSPPCQSHIATSLGPHTSSGGLGRGSDQFGVSSPTTRTRLGRSRSSSTLRTTFNRPGTSSRTAPRRATATWGPRRRRGTIRAAPTTVALTTSPSPIRAQPRRRSAMSHTQPSRRSRAGPNIDVKAAPWTRDGPRTTPTQPGWFHPGCLLMDVS